tara:strand:+ start:1692 stop:2519 length:828 start_codon:yes stop_codon:yes gene_type:complete
MATSQRSQEEKLLRENIRSAIKIVLQKRRLQAEREQLEEATLRKIVRGLIAEAKQEVPLQSTAMNKLRDVLNNIIPNIKKDYQALTTDKEQRESFEVVLMALVDNLLQTTEMNLSAGEPVEALAEVKVRVGDDATPGDDDEEGIIELEGEEPPEGEKIAKEIGLDVEELDDTGRDSAVQTFNDAVKNQVAAELARLGDPKDREEFGDYLKKNVEQHLKTAEEEIAKTTADLDTAEEESKEVADDSVNELTEVINTLTEDEELEGFVDLDDLLSNL